MTRSWKKLVEEGKQAAKQEGDAKWELGDLALAVETSVGGDSRIKGDLRTYAEEIGVEYSTLIEYRRVAAQWHPSARASGCSWTVHRELGRANRRDLIRPGMTLRQAYALK